MSVDIEQNSYAQVRGAYVFHRHTLQKIRFPIVCAITCVFFNPNKSEIVLKDCRIQSGLFICNYEDNMIHVENIRGNLGRKK